MFLGVEGETVREGEGEFLTEKVTCTKAIRPIKEARKP